MSVLVRRLLAMAARKVAADPQVQAKAADVYQSQVRPRVKSAARETKANLDFARSELSDIARDIDPIKNPKAFLAQAKKRLYDKP